MSKIDINKDEKEAQIVIKRAMNQKGSVKKQLKAMVFKAIVNLKNNLKTDNGAISLRDIRKKLETNLISN